MSGLTRPLQRGDFANVFHSSLCSLGSHRLCPSYRKVDPKSVASRVKIELLPETELNGEQDTAVKLEGPDGQGALLVKEQDAIEDTKPLSKGVKVEDPLEW